MFSYHKAAAVESTFRDAGITSCAAAAPEARLHGSESIFVYHALVGEPQVGRRICLPNNFWPSGTRKEKKKSRTPKRSCACKLHQAKAIKLRAGLMLPTVSSSGMVPPGEWDREMCPVSYPQLRAKRMER
jgi:hypothetical protein